MLQIAGMLNAVEHKKIASWNFKVNYAEDLYSCTFTDGINKNVKTITEKILEAAHRFIPHGFRKDFKPYWSKTLVNLH